MFVVVLVELGREEDRGCPWSQLGVELLLGPGALQGVDWPSVDDLLDTVLGEAVVVGDVAVVGRAENIGPFAPGVFDHVGVGGHGSAALREAAVGGVLLVLQASFFVGLCLLALPSLFQTYYDTDGDHDDEGDEGGDGGNDDDMFGREGRLRGYPRAGRGARRGFVAGSTAETRGTLALEIVDAVDAYTVVLTRIRGATVDLDTAVFTGESWRALAPVVVGHLQTGTSVGTRFRNAIVHAVLAQMPHEPGHALTTELVDPVQAGRAVLTRIPLTVVDVCLTARSREPRGALALNTPRTVSAFSGVLARIRLAIVHLMFAVHPIEPYRTGASVARACFGALGPVLARLVRTRPRGLLAERAAVTARANAAVVRGVGRPHATAPIQTGCLLTVVDKDLALLPGEARRAITGVTSLAGVEADTAVAARLMVGAEIEVLVAK